MELKIDKEYLRVLETTQKDLHCHNCFTRDNSQWYFDESVQKPLCEKCAFKYFPTMRQKRVDCTFFAIGKVEIIPPDEAET